MKRLSTIVIIFLTVVLLGSCSSSREARTMRGDIKGDWVLQTITTQGIVGVTKTTVFNEAEFGCFIGSGWNFIGNNSMGSYSIVDPKCAAAKRNFRWSVFETDGAPKMLQFKRLDDKKKAMDNGDGFRLTIVQLDDTQMKLRSDITFEGKPASLTYNFIRH
jgi:hypothetical protein